MELRVFLNFRIPLILTPTGGRGREYLPFLEIITPGIWSPRSIQRANNDLELVFFLERTAYIRLPVRDSRRPIRFRVLVTTLSQISFRKEQLPISALRCLDAILSACTDFLPMISFGKNSLSFVKVRNKKAYVQFQALVTTSCLYFLLEGMSYVLLLTRYLKSPDLISRASPNFQS